MKTNKAKGLNDFYDRSKVKKCKKPGCDKRPMHGQVYCSVSHSPFGSFGLKYKDKGWPDGTKFEGEFSQRDYPNVRSKKKPFS